MRTIAGGLRHRLMGRLLQRVGVDGRDRGDVPGWVLVTLMTAGLVTALWLIAGPALAGVFQSAIDGVTGP
ncbi:hypothetical protein ACPPVS_04780 [Cellulomonas sp. McL0617]|uniref:hypothetical protein n=1 Tax=Cellulomonas sp. McL0617 TaxID=3415675 RepID=UPI003CF3AD54